MSEGDANHIDEPRGASSKSIDRASRGTIVAPSQQPQISKPQISTTPSQQKQGVPTRAFEQAGMKFEINENIVMKG